MLQMNKKNKNKGAELLPSSHAKFLRYSPHLIFIIAFLIYLPTIKSGFVYCDDDIVILDNYDKISNLSNFGSAFTHDAYFSNSYPYYRPLLTTSLIIDAQLGGKEPGMYHFTNLLIHCLTCISLFWLFTLLGFDRRKSLFGALLFAVHPLIANAVLCLHHPLFPGKQESSACRSSCFFCRSAIFKRICHIPSTALPFLFSIKERKNIQIKDPLVIDRVVGCFFNVVLFTQYFHQ
jgi:hypothetical protein